MPYHYCFKNEAGGLLCGEPVSLPPSARSFVAGSQVFRFSYGFGTMISQTYYTDRTTIFANEFNNTHTGIVSCKLDYPAIHLISCIRGQAVIRLSDHDQLLLMPGRYYIFMEHTIDLSYIFEEPGKFNCHHILFPINDISILPMTELLGLNAFTKCIQSAEGYTVAGNGGWLTGELIKQFASLLQVDVPKEFVSSFLENNADELMLNCLLEQYGYSSGPVTQKRAQKVWKAIDYLCKDIKEHTMQEISEQMQTNAAELDEDCQGITGMKLSELLLDLNPPFASKN